jgi:predicted O-methyltransferase YrrM
MFYEDLRVFISKAKSRLLSYPYYLGGLFILKMLEARCRIRNGDLFDVPFLYQGPRIYKTISPTQIIQEIRGLYDIIKALQPRYVCEIGTDKGGTFYLWCKSSSDDAVLVSIDLPSRKRYSPARRRLYRHFGKSKRQALHFIASDSHQPATLELVRRAVGEHPLDFLFIDGDHTYEGSRQDYEMYAPLVRPGGLIAFHDIATERADCGVPRLWEEIKRGYPGYREIIYGERGPLGCGIGLIWKDGRG